jgi:hypothetical protein
VPQDPGTCENGSDSTNRPPPAMARRTPFTLACMVLVTIATTFVARSAIRWSFDHVLVAFVLANFLVTVLSLLLALIFAHRIKLEVLRFAREAVRRGQLKSEDVPRFAADLHRAIRHKPSCRGTCVGRERLRGPSAEEDPRRHLARSGKS